MSGKRKNQKRKLKDYELDVDVIDLDSYVAFHTQNYNYCDVDEEELENESNFISFTPEEPFDDVGGHIVFTPITSRDYEDDE